MVDLDILDEQERELYDKTQGNVVYAIVKGMTPIIYYPEGYKKIQEDLEYLFDLYEYEYQETDIYGRIKMVRR